MVKNIIHPITGKIYDVMSDIGKEILKSYIIQYKNGGSRHTSLDPTKEEKEHDEFISRVESGYYSTPANVDYINRNYNTLIMPYLVSKELTTDSLIKIISSGTYRELEYVLNNNSMDFSGKDFCKIFNFALESIHYRCPIDFGKCELKSQDHYLFPIHYILEYIDNSGSVLQTEFITNKTPVSEGRGSRLYTYVLHNVIQKFGNYYKKKDDTFIKFNLKGVLLKIINLYYINDEGGKLLLKQRTTDMGRLRFTAFHLMLKKFKHLYLEGDEAEFMISLMNNLVTIYDDEICRVYDNRRTLDRNTIHGTYGLFDDLLKCAIINDRFFEEVLSKFSKITNYSLFLYRVRYFLVESILGGGLVRYETAQVAVDGDEGPHSAPYVDEIVTNTPTNTWDVVRFLNEKTTLLRHHAISLNCLKILEVISEYIKNKEDVMVVELCEQREMLYPFSRNPRFKKLQYENIIECLEYMKEENVFLSGLNGALYPFLESERQINDYYMYSTSVSTISNEDGVDKFTWYGKNDEIIGPEDKIQTFFHNIFSITVGKRYSSTEDLEHGTYDDDIGVPVTLGELFTDSDSVSLFVKKYNKYIKYILKLLKAINFDFEEAADHHSNLIIDTDDVDEEIKKFFMIDIKVIVGLYNNIHTRRICFYYLLGKFYNFIMFFENHDIVRGEEDRKINIHSEIWFPFYYDDLKPYFILYFSRRDILTFNPFYFLVDDKSKFMSKVNRERRENLEDEMKTMASIIIEFDRVKTRGRYTTRKSNINIQIVTINNGGEEPPTFHPIETPLGGNRLFNPEDCDEHTDCRIVASASGVEVYREFPMFKTPVYHTEVALKIDDTVIWADDRINDIIQNRELWKENRSIKMHSAGGRIVINEIEALLDSPLSIYNYDILSGEKITYEEKIDELISFIKELN